MAGGEAEPLPPAMGLGAAFRDQAMPVAWQQGWKWRTKFLVRGTLGLCILLRGLQQHPPAAPAQPCVGWTCIL